MIRRKLTLEERIRRLEKLVKESVSKKPVGYENTYDYVYDVLRFICSNDKTNPDELTPDNIILDWPYSMRFGATGTVCDRSKLNLSDRDLDNIEATVNRRLAGYGKRSVLSRIDDDKFKISIYNTENNRARYSRRSRADYDSMEDELGQMSRDARRSWNTGEMGEIVGWEDNMGLHG